MGISTDRPWRQPLIFFAIILLLTALFTSRALLSSGLFAFLLLTCAHSRFPAQCRRFFTHPILPGMALLFFIPLVSGLWSDDKQVWWRFVRIKLPLLLLPLAFAGEWTLSPLQWRRVAYCFLALVLAGCGWSLWMYAANLSAIHQGYLQSKTIPTPLDNDHIRYSLTVCIAVLCAALLLKRAKAVKEKILLASSALFFIAYLHILAARTGLLSLYALLLLGAFYLLLTNRKKGWAVAVSLALLLLPLLAWMALPTFRNRIHYVVYDFSYLRRNQYLPGANDGNRALSLKAGWHILSQNPLGVGSGDVWQKTDDWYRAEVPQMLHSDKFYPSSEWLMYGAGAGWPGVLLFTIAMVLPFFEKRVGDRFFWISLNSIAAFSFLFDIGLESQFGVFIYAFIILWWWKWLQGDSNAAITQ